MTPRLAIVVSIIAAVSEITERLWTEYEGFSRRDLSEHDIVYLFIDGIEERLRPGLRWRSTMKAARCAEDTPPEQVSRSRSTTKI